MMSVEYTNSCGSYTGGKHQLRQQNYLVIAVVNFKYINGEGRLCIPLVEANNTDSEGSLRQWRRLVILMVEKKDSTIG